MTKRLAALLAATSLALTALAPGVAAADEHWRGGYGRGYDHDDWRGYDRYRGGYGRYDGGHHHNDHGDAVAAGVVGLALGAILGAAVKENSQPPRYYAAPPPAYYPPPPPPRYYGGGYGGGYYAGPQECTLRERVWDPYLGQYVRVERRVPC